MAAASNTNFKARLVVADDDVEILTMVAQHLRRNGYEVTEANDGEEALEKIRREKPDAVVLDVMMPGMSGWEVCRELRDDPKTRPISVLMLTAIGERLNEMTSPLYGADAALDKPFNFSDLDKVLEDLLKKKRTP